MVLPRKPWLDDEMTNDKLYFGAGEGHVSMDLEHAGVVSKAESNWGLAE